MKSKKYTEQTEAIVVELVDKGLDFPLIIKVKYNVNGIDYIHQEQGKYFHETNRAGLIPVGQRHIPLIKNIKVGDKINVKYKKNNPKKAFWSQNMKKGRMIL